MTIVPPAVKIVGTAFLVYAIMPSWLVTFSVTMTYPFGIMASFVELILGSSADRFSAHPTSAEHGTRRLQLG
jgi:hypothetical protein